MDTDTPIHIAFLQPDLPLYFLLLSGVPGVFDLRHQQRIRSLLSDAELRNSDGCSATLPAAPAGAPHEIELSRRSYGSNRLASGSHAETRVLGAELRRRTDHNPGIFDVLRVMRAVVMAASNSMCRALGSAAIAVSRRLAGAAGLGFPCMPCSTPDLDAEARVGSASCAGNCAMDGSQLSDLSSIRFYS